MGNKYENDYEAATAASDHCKKISICHLTSASRNRIPRLIREVDSSSSAGFKNYIVCVGESEEENNVQYIGIRCAKGRFDRFGKHCRELFKSGIKLDADVYQLHNPEMLRYAGILKRKGKKVIFDSHEHYLTRIQDREWIPTFLRKALDYVFKVYIKKCLKNVDVVLGVNEQIVSSLNHYHSDCRLITNFPKLRELSNLNKFSGFNICYTGAITDQYCIIELVDALAKISGVTAKICGTIDPDYLASIEQNPNWKKIDYLGPVTFKDAVEIQELSNVGIVLLKYSNNTNGKYGTMGNTKLFEYMMSGLPVICTDFTCWEEIINKYECGICVAQGDEASLISAIEFFRDNPEQTRIMGNNARKAAEEEYNWTLQGEKLIEVYRGM